MTEELTEIIDRMASLLADAGSERGKFLPTQHAATFDGLVLDAKSILDDKLGRANDHSIKLVSTGNYPKGMYGGLTFRRLKRRWRLFALVFERLNVSVINHLNHPQGRNLTSIDSGWPLYKRSAVGSGISPGS